MKILNKNGLVFEKAIKSVGTDDENFSFDCERPKHEVLILPFEISNKLVTNGEWIEFIDIMVIIKVNIGCPMDFQNASRKIGSLLFIGKKKKVNGSLHFKWK